MYHFDDFRLPTSEDEFWATVEEQLEFVKETLFHMPIETKEDALTDNARTRRRRSGFVLRWRPTTEEFDSFDYYLGMGQEAYDAVREIFQKRTLTPQFVHLWGRLMFCQGFITSFALDDSDGLDRQRKLRQLNTERVVDRQRIWVSRILHREMTLNGLSRKAAERKVVEAAKRVLDDPASSMESQEFCRSVLRPGGKLLKTTYGKTALSPVDIEAYANGDAEGLPPST